MVCKESRYHAELLLVLNVTIANGMAIVWDLMVLYHAASMSLYDLYVILCDISWRMDI